MQTQKLDFRAMPSPLAATPPTVVPMRLKQTAFKEVLTLDLVRSMESLEAEWRQLEQDNLSSLHQSYDWCLQWVKAHRYPVIIVRGTFEGRPAFILPLELVRTHGVKTARFIAAPHNNINTGLFSAEFLALADRLSSEFLQYQLTELLRGEADMILLQNMPLDWRGRKSPFAGLPTVENQNHAFQLPLLESFEATLQQINSKSRRKKFRVHSKRFEAAGGYQHVIASTDEEQHALLDVFFKMKSLRFKEAGLPDVFKDAETRAFLHGLLDASKGPDPYALLQMHALRLKGFYEGQIVAVAALSRKGDHVICQFAAIDDDLIADSSPGEFLYWWIISAQQASGLKLFDFGIGDQRYKRSWCPIETTHHDIIIPLSAAGRLASLLQRTTTRLKAAIKRQPRLYAFLQRRRAARLSE